MIEEKKHEHNFLFYEENDYKLYQGKMQDVLDTFQEESVDCIISDPPYELNFMGKKWDNSGVAFQQETWEKCFRVLKKGGYLLAFGGSRTFHRIACAIEDAGFEIRDCIMWLYGCYSSDTQVLTNKGWKYFCELDKTEKVLQWDKDNDKLSWVKPLNYFEYNIDDELVLLQNRHTEQLITKNHKIVCDIKKNHKQYHNKYDYIEAQQILKSDCVKLPLASYYYGSLHYKYAYIIGWFLTDAWIHTDGKAVCFSQSKKNTLIKLKNELEQLKKENLCEYSEYIRKRKKENQQEEHSFYVTGKIANYLINEFPNREFKEEFIELDKESKDKLLEGLIDGDGSCRKNSYSYTFWSKKDFRNNILSAMLTTMGYRNYISYSNGHKGVVFNTKHQTTEIQFKHKKPNIKYIGKVYCLQTETGAFVVRRNGKPFISGNSGFPKSMNIGKGIEAKEKLGNAGTRNKRKIEQSCDSEEYSLKQTNNGAMGEIIETTRKEYIAGTELSKKWSSWGTCLKPAYEPIIVARKPFKGSLVDNVIENGVGGINIDECKVNITEADTYDLEKRPITKGKEHNNLIKFTKSEGWDVKHGVTDLGRFPANVILTYDENDFEEVCGGFPDTKSGSKLITNKEVNRKGLTSENPVFNINNCGFKTNIKNDSVSNYGDEGSASRYFYCAKATTKDRDEGLDLAGFETVQITDGSVRANPETGRKFGGNPTPRRNIHPTIKPTELMEYLIKLVAPKGSVILDPFMGSGSTGKAVMFQNRERNANYKFIGIEMTPEYLPICQARIDFAKNKYEYETKKELEEQRKTNGQQNIFDFL